MDWIVLEYEMFVQYNCTTAHAYICIQGNGGYRTHTVRERDRGRSQAKRQMEEEVVYSVNTICCYNCCKFVSNI